MNADSWHGSWVLDDPTGVRLGPGRMLVRGVRCGGVKERLLHLHKTTPALWTWLHEGKGPPHAFGWRLDEPRFRWGVSQEELRGRYLTGLWKVSPGSPTRMNGRHSQRVEEAMLHALRDEGVLRGMVSWLLTCGPEPRRWGFRLAAYLG